LDSLVVVTNPVKPSSVSSALTLEEIWDFQTTNVLEQTLSSINDSSADSKPSGYRNKLSPIQKHNRRHESNKYSLKLTPESAYAAAAAARPASTTSIGIDQMMVCARQKIQGHEKLSTPVALYDVSIPKACAKHTRASTLDSNIFSQKGSSKAAYTDQPSEVEREDEKCLGRWGIVSDADNTRTPIRSMINSKEYSSKICVTLEDYDMDHLTLLQDEAFNFQYNFGDDSDGMTLTTDDEEESCQDSEKWIIANLEKQSSFLYWLQLTTELKNPQRLIRAMQGNTTIRNATVYPAVFRGLSTLDRTTLVTVLCQIPNLQNLIVFQDCGNYFLEPLTQHAPPLRRLTLYKLDIVNDQELSLLSRLLQSLPVLEELELEKYKGPEAEQLLNIMSGVLPALPTLKTLSLTPAKNVMISSVSFCRFLCALMHNKSIKTLSLQGSDKSIDQTCINELVKALRVNSTLEDVKLSGFWKNQDSFWRQFDPRSQQQLDYYLRLNRAGIRHFQLDVNASYSELAGAILSHRENLDHVFYLLSNNPSIVHCMAGSVV